MLAGFLASKTDAQSTDAGASMPVSNPGAGTGSAGHATAPTQTAPAAPAPFSDRLTRDWGGARSSMAAHGVTFDFDWTGYYQGLMAGTDDGDDGFEPGGRFDAFLNLDTKKMGLWAGGAFRTHAEWFYGDLNANLGGTLLPTNLGVRLPNGGGDIELTSFYLTQRLGSRGNLMVGKINTVDLLASHPFFGGWGSQRALNLAFAAPPNGLLPPVIGGAIVSVATTPVSWTFMVFDPDDRTLDYWMKNFFENGVNLSVSAKHNSRLAGRTTGFTVTGIYSTKNSASLGEVLLPPDLQTEAKDSSWHASVQFDHFLHENPKAPGTGWGLFVKAGVSDGNPNPYQAFITGGIGGTAPFASRHADSFGLGYFSYNFSDALQSAINPLVPFHDEQGIEAYYNFAATGWIILAGDVQYVNPGIGGSKNAFVGGLRARVRF